MSHRYQATIDLLRSVIHRLPAVFPSERHQVMDARLNEFERNPNATLDDIESAIITFGKELWPYVEAYETFYKLYGEPAERALMREKLSPASRDAFDRFIGEGGRVEDVRGGSRFESFFNTDIRAEIVNSELSAHESVHEEMERLIAGEKKDTYATLRTEHEEKRAAIGQKIEELRTLTSRAGRFASEMSDKIKTFEMGFAYVERAPTVEDVSREIQYYIDIADVEP